MLKTEEGVDPCNFTCACARPVLTTRPSLINHLAAPSCYDHVKSDMKVIDVIILLFFLEIIASFRGSLRRPSALQHYIVNRLLASPAQPCPAPTYRQRQSQGRSLPGRLQNTSQPYCARTSGRRYIENARRGPWWSTSSR